MKSRIELLQLELPSQTRIHPVFNSNVLKRAATNSFPGQQLQNKPPPDIIKGQEEYKVEAILDKKVKRNGIQYRVKWKGYEKTTWEPTSNFRQARNAVKDFEQRNMRGNQLPNRHSNGRKAWRKDEAHNQCFNELL